MHILAFNASPHRDKGHTHRILAPFLEGAAEAGATTETLMVRDLDVKPCIACMTCWYATPEQCAQDDDMTDVLEKVRAADVVVLGTPVYVDGMVGQLKVVLDRMIPLLHPEMEMRDGHMRHPITDRAQGMKFVLVSVCGFHEIDSFDPLVAHVDAVCSNMGQEPAGKLLRPHAHGMEVLEHFGNPPTDVFDACREAGRQVVLQGRIDPAVEDRVSQTLMPREAYLNGANRAMAKLKLKRGASRADGNPR